MKVVDRSDARKKTKFCDACTDNSCIIWLIAVFNGDLPAYILKNTPKKWKVKFDKLYEYMDPNTVDEIKNEIKDISNVSTIICEYEFSWVDDPRKHINDQILGQNIASWLYRNGNHKKLIYAESWNKID